MQELRSTSSSVQLEISVFSFYGCLPFVRTIATEATSAPRKPEKKRSEQKQLKENPFTGSHAMCLFFRNNNSEAFFFSYRSSQTLVSTQTDLWSML